MSSVSLPFEFLIGLRYTRSGRRTGRKDRFVSFISATSVVSIALGVMALIIVLSVMNGFQTQVRDRMLSVIPHIQISSGTGPVSDWRSLAAVAEKNSEVRGAAPFVEGQGLISTGDRVIGTMVEGVDPKEEVKASEVASTMPAGTLDSLTPGSFHAVIGSVLAARLGVAPGDKIALVVPQGTTTPAGMIPRVRTLTVSGIFTAGHFEYDSTMLFMNIEDAAALFRTGGPMGVRVRVADMQEAPAVAESLMKSLPPGYFARDWTVENKTWFAAVQVEKRMMSIILFLIVLVGAFGLVSTLVMTVTEKQSDIAILRTLGASPGSIMKIFMIQGAVIGVIGVASGVAIGLLIACNLGSIVSAIEAVFHVEFLPQSIYLISGMPSEPRASDIIPIAVFSLFLSLAATVYPSWRASRIRPAEALRYE
ncbi:MAG: lipoprotein-releasing ABC transporter permease subunit [Mesosutterella multiformis]|nr:lipoprotein-releasing ABC transporter permease subunit [Mesosutterella multiformis]MBS5811330.1 lipoprotein-releasing ABC transporter permease subunit [Sutterella sp.]MCH3935448.1 lipoprotein-releasing ABC transporter permease subunit [Mesosutterella sp.]RGU78429.1 lipoprotein-releasing ABC transporter permease subunit [Sutterella sp. AF15-45LB]RGU79806.1 lipoprotein-releasing ABC transporter permease subunit [Sutterella sp. AF15-44LB]RHH07823.1 lipoprotein-releasing ABC transporter permeas